VQTSRGPGRAGPAGAVSLALSAGLAALVALVVCGRSLGHGLYLYRDFVTVPDPVLNEAARGGGGQAPRAVPLDAVTAVLAPAVPPGVQQQLMLVASVFLAGLGTAVLLRRHGLPAMATGVVVAAWNPFVAERVLVGQPPTLLAYAMTPWVIAAVRSRLRGWRSLLAVTAAALPAALTPWGGLATAGVALATAAVTPHRRSARWLAALVAVAITWCLPWVVPALVHPQPAADPDGALAFSVRSDSPLGRLGSVLTLGGIWAQAVPPPSRGTVTATLAACLVAALAAAGLVAMLRRGSGTAAPCVGAAWLAPPLLAVLLSFGPGLALFTAMQSVPGVAIARDTHRWLGLSAIAAAVLAGQAVAAVSRRARRLGAGRVLGGAAALCASSLAVLTVPDLPHEVEVAYQPITMPRDWDRMVASTQAVAGGGDVLVTPWSAFRQTAWNAGRPFLDPLSRALQQHVVQSHELVVIRDHRVVRVDEDQSVIDGLVHDGRYDSAALRRAGISTVVQWRGTPGQVPLPDAGMTPVLTSADFVVWSVTRGG
jgi:hypothetical protein